MKLELKPEIVGVVKRQGDSATNAGMSRDGQISWTYSAAFLEVALSHTNEILASWRFGKHQKDTHTIILCVSDLQFCGGHLLIVSTSNHTDVGILNIFSIEQRRVLRVIEVPQRVTALDVVFTNVGEDVPGWILNKHLQFFSGLVAAGTEAGYVYLIDLCLDELLISERPDTTPRKLKVHGPGIVEPKAKREQAMLYDKHMAICLDDQCHRNGHFYFKRQDDTVQKVLDEDSVTVTSLKYMSQAGMLAVGFNFGSFQLWKLYNPVLEYSSRYSPEGVAVSHFVVQEPENDPRNFIYLWVGYDDSTVDSIANICLYQLSFGKKDVYTDFGMHYDELESVCPRLDHKLTTDAYSSETSSTRSSSLINCYTITNPYYTPPLKLSETFEEGLYSNDLSLSVFVWRADGSRGDARKHWMCIFDLNRWYHAQMPHKLRCIGASLQVCSYWAVFDLAEILQTASASCLLNVELSGDKVLRFINNSPLPPEEHSYPSALRLTSMQFILGDACLRARCDGWQGQLLSQLARDGAELLVQPADFYHRCYRARLLPQNYEELRSGTAEYQRKMLLNIALDYGITSTLVPQCIHHWADGEFAEQGCTLNFLLNWAWDKMASIKQSWDSTCEILYDWSCQHLDRRTDWQMESQTESLSNLRHIFAALITQSGPTTESGQAEMELRMHVITILLQHCEAVRWCVSFHLLPEIDEASDPMPGLFAYPISRLQEAYAKRRIELSGKKRIVKDFSLLLIDDLLECQGSQVKKLWETLGGNGLYPPPSMQALVNMYLIDEISSDVKHAITLYLLQDLAALSTAEVGDAVIASFVQRFMLSPSLVHQIQGLWFIDHKDFEEGVRHLVNPSVHDDFCGSWKHVAIANTLLSQSEGKAATRYLHTKGILGASPQEQQLYISVLLHNREVSQALEYMRGCQNETNSPQLLAHLLDECHNYKLLGHLLQMNLTESEETYLELYLRHRGEHHALEPLLLYYLHHSRFLQAFQLNEDMKRMDKFEMSHVAQERAATRNCLVDAYMRALPDVTRKLLMEKQRGASYQTKRVEVQRPKPLSTVVHRADHVAMSRSHFVMAVLEKVNEAQDVVMSDAEDKEDHTANDFTESKINSPNIVPFLSTPRTPKHKQQLRASEVIYPDLKLSPMVTNPLSSAKRKTLLDSGYGHVNGNISLRQLTQECLQLLQTPIRNHKKKSENPMFGTTDSHIKTPQSILKVQRLSKTILSDSKDGSRRSSVSNSVKLGFPGRSSLKISTSSPPKAKALCVTPVSVSAEVTAVKQLRFVGISPSPASSPTMDVGSPSIDSLEEVTNREEETITSWKHEKQTESLISAREILPRGESGTEPAKISTSPTSTVERTVSRSFNISTRGLSELAREQPHTEREHPSFEEGPDDRYENEQGELVRPSLQSSWKHGQQQQHRHSESAPHLRLHTSPHDPAWITDTTADIENTMEVEEQNQSKREIVSTTHTRVVEESSDTVTTKYSHEIATTSTRYLQLSVDTGTSLTTHPVESSSPLIGTRRNLSLLASSSHNLRSQKSSSISPTSFSPAETGLSETHVKSRLNESPPATPPSSKKARVLELKSRELEQVRKKMQSTPSPERHETDEPRRRKTPERKSPSRKMEKEEILERHETDEPRRRKTPERKSPSWKMEKEEILERHETDEPRRRKTPERKSPSRKMEKEQIPERHQTGESQGRKTPERKTPERRSPSRVVQIHKEVEIDEEVAGASPEKKSPPRKVQKLDDKIVPAKDASSEPDSPKRRRKTPERQSLGRKSLKEPVSGDDKAENYREPQNVVGVSHTRKSPYKHGEVETLKDNKTEKSEDVSEKSSEADSSETRMVRRSTRLKTPDRLLAESTVPSGRAARLNTPDRIQAEGSLTSGRSTRLKTPDRVLVESLEAPEPSARQNTPDRVLTENSSASGHSTRLKTSDRELVDVSEPLSQSTRLKTPDRVLTEVSEPSGWSTRLKTPDRVLTEPSGRSTRLKTPDRVLTEVSEPSGRSTRLKTPDRVLAEVSEPSLSPLRGIRRSQRTPQKAASKATLEDKQKDDSEATQKKSPRKKISERVEEISEVEHSEEKKTDQPINTARSSGRHKKKDMDKNNEEEEEELQNSRRSTRKSKTPDRLIPNVESNEPLTPTRKSRRHQKSPELLKVPEEIESAPGPAHVEVSPKGKRKTRASSKEPAATEAQTSSHTKEDKTEPPEQLSVNETEPTTSLPSPSRSSRRATRGSAADLASSSPKKSRSETQDILDISSSRKTPDRQLKGSKKAGEEEVMETGTEVQESKSPGRSQKSWSRQTKSPARQQKLLEQKIKTPTHKAKKKDEKSEGEEDNVEESADGWSEEMPPLRLEVDDNDNPADDTEAEVAGISERSLRSNKGPDSIMSENPLPSSPIQESKTAKLSRHIKDLTAEAGPAFVFSPPLKQTSYSNDHTGGSDERTVDAEHVFVFSQPTVAADSNVNEEVLEEKPDTTESVRRETGLKSKRKKALFTESPILLSPGGLVSHRSLQRKFSEKRKHSIAPKAQAPRTRRIKPPSWTEPTTSRQ